MEESILKIISSINQETTKLKNMLDENAIDMSSNEEFIKYSENIILNLGDMLSIQEIHKPQKKASNKLLQISSRINCKR